jgi:hypothetical protein
MKHSKEISPRERKKKSGADLLVGLLKDTNHKSSEQEQHKIEKLWTKAAEERSGNRLLNSKTDKSFTQS